MSLSQYLGSRAEGWKENQWLGGTISSITFEHGQVVIVLKDIRVWMNRSWCETSDKKDVTLMIPVQEIGTPDQNGLLVIGDPGQNSSTAILYKHGSMPLSRDLSDLLLSPN